MRRISPIGWLLIVFGVICIVFAVIYLTTTAPNLPSFVPGAVTHVKHARKYTKRGILALVIGLASFTGVYYVDFRN